MVWNPSCSFTDYPENSVSILCLSRRINTKRAQTPYPGYAGAARTPLRRNFGSLQPDSLRSRRGETRSPSLHPGQILLPGFAAYGEPQQHLVFGLVHDGEGNWCRKTFNMKGACIPQVQIRNNCDTRAALRDVKQFGRRPRPPRIGDSHRHVDAKSRELASIGVSRCRSHNPYQDRAQRSNIG